MFVSLLSASNSLSFAAMGWRDALVFAFQLIVSSNETTELNEKEVGLKELGNGSQNAIKIK